MDLKRIQRELIEHLREADSDNSVSWGIIDETNKFQLQGIIMGPDGTPYEGGLYFVNLELPRDYPFKPPKVNLTTKIYHLNVNPNGLVCCCHLEILGN